VQVAAPPPPPPGEQFAGHAPDREFDRHFLTAQTSLRKTHDDLRNVVSASQKITLASVFDQMLADMVAGLETLATVLQLLRKNGACG
jgi:hypothetical protein